MTNESDLLHFVVFDIIPSILSISFRFTSLTLHDCPSASEVIMNNMGKSTAWNQENWGPIQYKDVVLPV